MEHQDFQHIAVTLRPRLMALCKRFFDCQDMAWLAEDAVQETLLRLWQMRDRISTYQSPEALAVMMAMAQETVYVINGQQVDHFDGSQLIGRTIRQYQVVTLPDSHQNVHHILTTDGDTVTLVAYSTHSEGRVFISNGMTASMGLSVSRGPLVILDGQEFFGDIGDIPDADISSINVFVAGSDVARSYGEKGEYGVMQVTSN